MNRRTNPKPARDPWALVWGQPYIDSQTLATAIEDDLQCNPHPDFRTKLLVRDAAKAIKSFWGPKRFGRWLEKSPAGETISALLKENLGQIGFHFIRRRLVASVGRDQIEQILELLGRRIHERVEVNIAGSIPTLLKGLTARPTDDIDFVNEVPQEIRKQKAVIDQIKNKYGLLLGHVQSHYLPANWINRREYLGDFGGIRAYLVDALDIFVSKLSSKQEKHKDDLRVMAPKLDRDSVKQRLLIDGKAFLDNPYDRPTIEENWQFIYREPLSPQGVEGRKGVGRGREIDKQERKPKRGNQKRR
jgi:Nucleotidyltransferase of unknown function (DUF6036)